MVNYAQGKDLADRLHDEFGFDFVAVSLVPERATGDTLAWQCVAGNTNTRYQRIFLPSNVGILGMVYAEGRPLIVDDANVDISQDDLYQYPIVSAEGIVSFVGFPLFEKGDDARFIAHEPGVAPQYICLCAFRVRRPLDTTFIKKVQERAAEFTGFVPSSQDSFRPPRGERVTAATQLTHGIIQAQEAERKRIARELHDGISQELLLAQIELRKIKYLPEDEKEHGVELASERLRDIMAHVSSLAADLRPASLDELGLEAAMREHCVKLERSFGIEVRAEIDEVPGLSADEQTALYRIFQEASMNACKYSQSGTLDVRLRQMADSVVLSIADHGIGFDTAHPTVRGGGLGLGGMRERAAVIGATLDISSSSEKGTEVRVALPIIGGAR